MSPTNLAIVLLVAGNFVAALSDVAVKLLDGGVPPFQYVFLRQLVAVMLLLPLWLRLNRQQRQLTNPGATLLRSHLIILGSGCMIVSLTYLPLATANAVFYTAPLLMLPLSKWLFGERPPADKLLATLIGFAGVLVLLRPSQFHWAALFALGTALTVALYNLLSRKLPLEQPLLTTLFWTSLLSLPLSSLLAWWYWQPVASGQLGLIASSALLILTYNGLAVQAYKNEPAANIALSEYSGLVFVALFGLWWFDEVPTPLSLVGMLLIVLAIFPYRDWQARRKARSLAATEASVRQSEEHH
ncbi:DMT family transporter [Vibrio sp.]|uniref:DMT family transporter n=1 Tax=Vibrio sp. TaxID=678 RepID=UPI003D09F979